MKLWVIQRDDTGEYYTGNWDSVDRVFAKKIGRAKFYALFGQCNIFSDSASNGVLQILWNKDYYTNKKKKDKIQEYLDHAQVVELDVTVSQIYSVKEGKIQDARVPIQVPQMQQGN